jgi:small subunit ribosomal protein S8
MGSVNDPIADLLTRIRNASLAKHLFVDVSHSKMKEEIVKILKEYGFVAHYLVKEENKKGTMRIFLKYTSQREAIIHGLKRVSKSSLRRYVSHGQIPQILGGMGISIISTSKGVMSGRSAKEQGIGGELLCVAW